MLCGKMGLSTITAVDFRTRWIIVERDIIGWFMEFNHQLLWPFGLVLGLVDVNKPVNKIVYSGTGKNK